MKNNFPQTSIDAYKSQTKEKLANDYILIIGALKKLKKANYDNIAVYLGLTDKNVISRRLKEMINKNLIKKSGTKSKSARGRYCEDYELTNQTEE